MNVDDGAAARFSEIPEPTNYLSWRDRLAKANDPQFWPIKAIDWLLENGKAQFWCDGTAALVTRVVEFPGGAVVLEAIAGSGSMDGLIGTIEEHVETQARQAGMTHLFAPGRHGWLRALSSKGWRHHQTIIVKDLA